MRSVAAVLFALVSLAACKLPGADGGGVGGAAGTGGSGGGPTGCDARSTCEDCAVCASEDVCAAPLAACQDDPTCVGLDECMLFCEGDGDCQESCRLQNAVGVEAWDAAATCLYCDACPTACAGSTFCE